MQSVVYSVYGKDVATGIIPVDYAYEDIQISGVNILIILCPEFSNLKIKFYIPESNLYIIFKSLSVAFFYVIIGKRSMNIRVMDGK